jgi:hypothetical protein
MLRTCSHPNCALSQNCGQYLTYDFGFARTFDAAHGQDQVKIIKPVQTDQIHNNWGTKTYIRLQVRVNL